MKRFFAILSMALALATGRLCAQSTAFTYHGWLMDAGAPAEGIYDLRFTLSRFLCS